MNRALNYAYSAEGQEEVTCPKCDGAGEIYVHAPAGVSPEFDDVRACDGCLGTGGVTRWWAGRYRKEWS